MGTSQGLHALQWTSDPRRDGLIDLSINHSARPSVRPSITHYGSQLIERRLSLLEALVFMGIKITFIGSQTSQWPGLSV